MTSPHRWKFVRIGGFDQVQLETGADLVSIGELDQKLWVALACPTVGVEFDARTLALIDQDHDGRVRAEALIAAAEWARDRVTDVEVLAEGSPTLKLSSIDVSTDEGRLLHETAVAILRSLDKPEAKEIGVADTGKALDAFDKRPFNGDGIVIVDAAPDDASKALVTDVLACTKAETDKSGKPGITAKSIEGFFDEAKSYAAWLAAGDADPAVRPFGESTGEAYDVYVGVRAKIDDFFARCRVAAFDPRALAAVNREESDYLAIAAKDLDITASELRPFPLAKVAPAAPLPLAAAVNPAWQASLATFRTKVVTPLLGDRTTLAEADWQTVRAKLAAHDAWLTTKKGASVEKLGPARVKELVSGDARAKLDALVAEEAKAEPLAKAIESVERLVHYNRDLLELANNIVSFRDFYERVRPAIFQVGTLYLDTRACELCVRVNDAGRHATMAPLANAYLVYCDCKNAKGQTMSIAAAMTAGDVDNLMVGRNGVFYDRKGHDWDATITKIIENPISVRQAFWAPYKKAVRLIEEQIAKRAADAAAASDARVGTAVDHGMAAATAGATPAPAPAARPKLDIGVVAALGVAVGGITAAMGALLSSFFGLGLWMPIGVVGLMMLISGPSMAVAWLKLRRRNLGPLLDANGWAVNAQAKINVPLGGSLTKTAALPKGASRNLTDPFAEKRRPWPVYAVALSLLTVSGSWYLGKLDSLLPSAARSVTVLGVNAPAYVRPPAAHAASHPP